MSLVSFAIRTCLKRVLLDKTMAGPRVHDSMVVPIDETPPQRALPKIIVSTDDDLITNPSLDLLCDKRRLDVLIETELSSEVVAEAGGVTVEIPLTDAALEASLDFLQREIFRAIAEPNEVWADLLRRLLGDVEQIQKRRGAAADKGVRFAARQIVITTHPTTEPRYGVPPNSLWSALIDAMKADDELAHLGDYLAKLIEGAPLPPWGVLQASLGHTDAAMLNLGAAPLPPEVSGP